MNFKGYEKVILNNGEKDYVFYVNQDIFNDSKNLTFLVDENDNILNAFSGRYPEIYKNILYIEPYPQQGAYYNIETGEQLFKEYTDKYKNNYRCFSSFEYGYASAYNDKTDVYDIFNMDGKIVNSSKSFRMFNEKRGILRQKYGNNSLSIIDENLNIIKENCFNEVWENNNNYIIGKVEDGKKSLCYMFDLDGNKLSKAYKTIETNDFVTFKVRNKEVGSKVIKMNLEEVLGK